MRLTGLNPRWVIGIKGRPWRGGDTKDRRWEVMGKGTSVEGFFGDSHVRCTVVSALCKLSHFNLTKTPRSGYYLLSYRWEIWGWLRVSDLPKSPSYKWQGQEPNPDNLPSEHRLWRLQNALEHSVPYCILTPRLLLSLPSWGSPPSPVGFWKSTFFWREDWALVGGIPPFLLPPSEASGQLSLGMSRQGFFLWFFLVTGACCPVSWQFCIFVASKC